MAISLSRYVNIQSAVGSGVNVPNRALIARFFSNNILLPYNTFLQFSSAADVGTYFGLTSEEYYRALFYFAWISKNLTSPPAIQFYNWVSSAVAPMVFPIPGANTASIASWQSVTAGSFGLTIGGVTNNFSSLNFSGVSTYADVAGIVQTAIRTGSGAQWTSAVVTFKNGGFYLTGGSAVNAAITVLAGTTGVDITALQYLGWLPASTYSNSLFNQATWAANAIWTPGSAIQTITSTLNLSVQNSNNFGSFGFLNNLGLDQAQVVEAATWNAAAAQNNMFLYSVPVIASNVTAWLAALATFGGTTVTLSQTPVVQTANLLGLTATVTGLMNAKSVLQVGDPVSGTYIPQSTVISSITNDNVIVLSNPAEAITNSESLTFTIVQNGTLTNTMDTVSGLSDTSLLSVGMNVIGTDIPSSTTIASIVDANNITMSHNATGSPTEDITFTIVQTGTVTSGSISVSGLTTTHLNTSMAVTGAYIPASTDVASVVDGTHVTLTNPVNDVAASESLTFNTVQFPEQAPMMIEAATNYYGVNTVQNYMFQNFDPYLTPLVTSDATSESYDALSLNYYGQTQTAGTQFNFYQRGLMQGGSSDASDQNTYVNEIWLKDALGAALLQLLLSLNQLPANNQGQALALLTIQGVINQALENGTISVGKTLSLAQQTFIFSISNDPNAASQVQNGGYWVDCVIQQIPNVSPIQFEAAYTLIYSKDDVIRLVTGSDILI